MSDDLPDCFPYNVPFILNEDEMEQLLAAQPPEWVLELRRELGIDECNQAESN